MPPERWPTASPPSQRQARSSPSQQWWDLPKPARQYRRNA